MLPDSSDGPEIRYLGDLQRLELKPGDALVLKYSGHLPEQTVKRLRECMEEQFPGRKMLILLHGMELGILGEGESTG